GGVPTPDHRVLAAGGYQRPAVGDRDRSKGLDTAWPAVVELVGSVEFLAMVGQHEMRYVATQAVRLQRLTTNRRSPHPRCHPRARTRPAPSSFVPSRPIAGAARRIVAQCRLLLARHASPRPTRQLDLPTGRRAR